MGSVSHSRMVLDSPPRVICKVYRPGLHLFVFSFADLICASYTMHFISASIAERNIQEVPHFHHSTQGKCSCTAEVVEVEAQRF